MQIGRLSGCENLVCKREREGGRERVVVVVAAAVACNKFVPGSPAPDSVHQCVHTVSSFAVIRDF